MKALKFLAAFAVLLIVIVLTVGLLTPGKFSAIATKTIDASPRAIFPLLNTPRHWPSWSAWSPENYPEMTYDYAGPAAGKGATSKWTDPGGSGQVTIYEAETNRRVAYTVDMDGGSLDCSFVLTPAADDRNTTVEWNCDGDAGLNPIGRMMTLVFVPMIEKDQQKGLDKLATLLAP